MRHGSLFSGIGGFDLAAEWMGWENVFHCEWNEFGQKVLKHYWPKAISYEDITKTDFSIHRGNIDILTGGFPCQPYSSAGKRLGKEDERHLWPQMLRAIREIKPRWVVGENVYGLVNWSGGLVFHEVQADLEAEGYEVQPYLLPAVSVNAPHRRDRIWFVAKNTISDGCLCGESKEKGAKIWEQRDTCTGSIDRVHLSEGFVAYANTNGFSEQRRYECSCQNDQRGISQSQWPADSENFDNGHPRRYLEREPRTNREIGSKGYTKEGEPSDSRGVRGMDKKCDKCQGFIKEYRDTINQSGTLVQERQSGVQLPINSRMGDNQTTIEPDRRDGHQNDYNNIKAMDRDATNTNRNGQHISHSEHEINTSEGRVDAQRYSEQSNGDGSSSYPNGIGLRRQGDGIGNAGFIGKNSKRSDWSNFPTVPPVRTGNDGFSDRLDGITFPKWRNESIKAGGNAVVPQVVYQIFKTIEQYEKMGI